MEVGKARRLPVSKCLSCGIANDAATPVGGDYEPEPGSITVCLLCGHVMAYAEDLQLRELTREEQIEMAGDERILAIQWGRKKLGIKRRVGDVEQ